MDYLRRIVCVASAVRERGLTLLIVALCTGAMLAGCRTRTEAQPDVLVTHEISPQPPRVGPATVTLKVTNDKGHAIAGAKINLEGNMTHAGMVPVFTEAVEVAPGRYQAPLEFNMSGDWVLLINLTLQDGRKLQRQVDVKGVQPGNR